MQIEIISNGGVSILLSPDNVMEEEMIKVLMKQDVSIQEIRSQVFVLGKSFKNGILIGKKSQKIESEPETEMKETKLPEVDKSRVERDK